MSVDLQSAVYRHGPREHWSFSVLHALADNANDQGVCWPKTGSIARKSRMSLRHVLAMLDLLEREGWISVERRVVRDSRKRRGGASNRYTLNLAKLQYVEAGDDLSAHHSREPDSREPRAREQRACLKPVDRLRKHGGKPLKKPDLSAHHSREQCARSPCTPYIEKPSGNTKTAKAGDDDGGTTSRMRVETAA